MGTDCVPQARGFHATSPTCSAKCGLPKYSRDHGCDLARKQRRNRISNLGVLRCPVPQEDIGVREGLQSCCFPHGQAATLLRPGMDEGMAVLGNVAGNGHAVPVADLDSEPVLEDRFAEVLGIDIPVVGQEAPGKVDELRALLDDLAECGNEHVSDEIAWHVRPALVVRQQA